MYMRVYTLNTGGRLCVDLCRRFLKKIGNSPELFGGSRLKTKNFALKYIKMPIYIETRVRDYETCHCTCLSFPKNDLKLVIPFREKL